MSTLATKATAAPAKTEHLFNSLSLEELMKLHKRVKRKELSKICQL